MPDLIFSFIVREERASLSAECISSLSRCLSLGTESAPFLVRFKNGIIESVTCEKLVCFTIRGKKTELSEANISQKYYYLAFFTCFPTKKKHQKLNIPRVPKIFC